MIAARQILLVILFGSTSCLALKGSKRNIRSVVGREQNDDAAHRKEPSQQSVIDDIPGAPKEQDNRKEEDTTDKKQSDKKADTKHKKACKKRQQKEDKKEPKEIPEEEPKEETEVNEKKEAADPVKVTEVKALIPEPREEELPWCEDPSIKKLGDCAMLYSGVYPKEETIGGSLAIEVTWKNDTLVQEMERLLKEETSLHAVGCGGRRLQENETDANNNVTVYLLAVDIGSASQSTENCTSNTKQADGDCTVVTSNVTIHYSGEATVHQKKAMFDTLTNTIQSQVDNGDFDDIASVHYAEAKMNKKGAQASAENNNNGSVGLIGGVFVAVAAAVALVVTGFVKKKGNSWNGCCGPAAVLPANNRGVLVDVLSEDVEDLWRLR